jgi:hypothetical protein
LAWLPFPSFGFRQSLGVNACGSPAAAISLGQSHVMHWNDDVELTMLRIRNTYALCGDHRMRRGMETIKTIIVLLVSNVNGQAARRSKKNEGKTARYTSA